MRHFIAVADHTPEQLRHFLDVALWFKRQLKATGRNDQVLVGKTLAMIFEKPSLRTRISFEVAMIQLGGQALVMSRDEIGLNKREPVQDVSRVLSGMCDAIMARVFEHEKITGLAKWASVPVVNGLSDYNHPCQAMGDMMTIEEHFGSLRGRTVCFVGDGNNVARSLAVACGKFGMKFILCSPSGYELSPSDIAEIHGYVPTLDFTLTRDPVAGVKSADVIYTDTWVSMGQEAEKAERIKELSGYQINAKLMQVAPSHAVAMHCLPAYRGMEITEDVLESPRSLVFPEAENRLHFQKGLLAVLMTGR